jgi:hypothetical protein
VSVILNCKTTNWKVEEVGGVGETATNLVPEDVIVKEWNVPQKVHMLKAWPLAGGSNH